MDDYDDGIEFSDDDSDDENMTPLKKTSRLDAGDDDEYGIDDI